MAIVVSLLVVVAVIAGGIFFYRRRQNSAQDEEEGEIPLGPRKQTLTDRLRGRGSGAFGKLRLHYPCHAVFNRGVSRSFQREGHTVGKVRVLTRLSCHFRHL